MKIKVKPEDFVVREKSLLNVGAAPAAYRIYRLGKKHWDTFDLVGVLARRLGVQKDDINLAGLKDRYGDSEQLISVRNRGGLPEKLDELNYSLAHEGYADRKMTAADIAGNSFRVTLRDVAPADVETVKRNCLAARARGFPNYFDEQRFGSARTGRGFLGKALFLGKMEEALKIYLAPSEYDRGEDKAFKTRAASLWRQWGKIDVPVPRKFAKVFAVLKAPGGYMAFNKAVNAIDRDLTILSLQAYQSFLFNRLLVHYLDGLREKKATGPLETYGFPYGDLLFYCDLPEETFVLLNGLSLPVPGHDTIVEDKGIRRALDAALAEENIGLGNLKVKKLHGKAVRGAERRAVVVPEEFAFDEPRPDELYPGRMKITLHFFLRRGSYATMLVKRLALGTENASRGR
ncbi:MAG: tRNA pseudouridine(13) synthase TruD [Spirochaetales bacterium]|nr:tRNA pseudouridine(13) synthase TruD [Spirochaetales bacterium]